MRHAMAGNVGISGLSSLRGARHEAIRPQPRKTPKAPPEWIRTDREGEAPATHWVILVPARARIAAGRVMPSRDRRVTEAHFAVGWFETRSFGRPRDEVYPRPVVAILMQGTTPSAGETAR